VRAIGGARAVTWSRRWIPGSGLPVRRRAAPLSALSFSDPVGARGAAAALLPIHKFLLFISALLFVASFGNSHQSVRPPCDGWCLLLGAAGAPLHCSAAARIEPPTKKNT